jgi:cysteine desulfurase
MRIYLDHNATAPLRAEARAAMVAVLGAPANPSSAHREGARARQLLATARAEIAALIGAAPADIVLTSGATEANNLALRAAAAAGTRLVTTAVEHASVLETARARGPVIEVGVNGCGRVAAADVIAACTPGTALASVGMANGEVGAIAPIAEIAACLRGSGVLLHTDAAQAAGRIPIDVAALGVDLLSLSAHKLGGPVGVGALWIRPGLGLAPQLTGGSQERGRRAGTENVAGAVGFGVAARLALEELETVAARMMLLTDRLWEGLRARVDVVRNGPADGPRLPNTLNVSFPGCAGESLLVLCDLEGIAASLGSACAAGAAEPSHVLRAMGRDVAAARDGLRLSLGRDTTAAEVERVTETLPRLVAAIRARSAA